jgi:hypothetical protein
MHLEVCSPLDEPNPLSRERANGDVSARLRSR